MGTGRIQTRRFESLFCAFVIVCTSVAGQTCIKRDRDALLKFKAGLKDTEKQLASWNGKSNCCKDFVGVTCNSKGEVIDLAFSGHIDEDCEEHCPFIGSKKPGEDLIGPSLSKLLALQTLNLSNVWLNGPFPTGLSALKNLSYLLLKGLGLEGPPSADIFDITSVRYLALDGLKEGLTEGICKLKNLEVLDAMQTMFDSFGGIGGTIPSCIGDLQQLREFLVEWNNITGTIPASIAELHKLQQLKLTGNFLTGQIPDVLGELKALEILYLQGNEFTGSIPSSLGNLSNLRDLRIGGMIFYDRNTGSMDLKLANIDGEIPATLGNLQNLQTLFIKSTKITGVIPSALGNARMLTELELDFNRLTGPLPSSLSRTNLTIFRVNDNQISGGIPPSYGDLRHLARFEAQRNRFTGPIPKEASKWRFDHESMTVLDLSDNMITGSIPEDLALALPYGEVNLSYNKLSGSLKPSSWYNIRAAHLNNNQLTSLGTASIPDDGETGLSVQIFDVHSNLISGPIPEWPFQFYQASAIDLSDNKFTSLPTISDKFTAHYINVSTNAIYGNIPQVFGNSSNINYLDMSRNKLYGSIPRGFGFSEIHQYLNVLDLSCNDLTGTIPNGVFDGGFFNTLNLRNNKLTGGIPERSSVNNNYFLREVDVTNNRLTGPIPASMFSSYSLSSFKAGDNLLTGGVPNLECSMFPRILVLENNQLTGPVLPNNITEELCYALEVFDVSGNNLTGELPIDLKKFASLKVLDLSFNSLTGRLKDFLGSLPSLRILDLSSNNFSGAFPWKKVVSGFTALQQPGASSIRFSTQSPLYEASLFYEDTGYFSRSDVTIFTSTTALNISHNALSGSVDTSIGQLKGLHALDLSSNKFSRNVPDTIADVTDLDYLDLSDNSFSGAISQSLRKFPARAFEGNPNLCGAPLSKSC